MHCVTNYFNDTNIKIEIFKILSRNSTWKQSPLLNSDFFKCVSRGHFYCPFILFPSTSRDKIHPVIQESSEGMESLLRIEGTEWGQKEKGMV